MWDKKVRKAYVSWNIYVGKTAAILSSKSKEGGEQFMVYTGTDKRNIQSFIRTD